MNDFVDRWGLALGVLMIAALYGAFTLSTTFGLVLLVPMLLGGVLYEMRRPNA